MPPHLQGWVTRVLRTGVVVMLVFLAAGLGLFVAGGGGSFLGSPAALAPGPVGALLSHVTPAGFLLLGLLVLVLTPLSRVVLSVVLFAASGDRSFTLITLFVLAILSATIIVGVLR